MRRYGNKDSLGLFDDRGYQFTDVSKILLLTDTHAPRYQVPKEVWEAASTVDLILHAGDVMLGSLIDDLQALAPVVAVAGNNDPYEVVNAWGTRAIIEAGAVRIGLVHGDRGRAASTVGRAAQAFAGLSVDVIVFGHSHMPYQKWHGSMLLVNPGSCTWPRRAPSPTFGMLEITPRIKVDMLSIGEGGHV